MNQIELEARIGYQFQDREKLEIALTHASFENSGRICSYGRLEFLGNYVLDLFLADFLYRHLPQNHEGTYSGIQAVLRSNRVLWLIGSHLDVRRFIRIGKTSCRVNEEKLVADVLEAIIGLIYLEAGIERVFAILGAWLSPELEQILASRISNKSKFEVEI